MANLSVRVGEDVSSYSSSSSSLTFADFPEDVQLCILSFLTPFEIASFSCTSKCSLSLCRNDSKVWLSMCERRWGSNTRIKKWGNGNIQFKRLYKTLDRWENLIGFWRGSGQAIVSVTTPSLVFFEWGPSFIAGSRISPSKTGNYQVIKTPFLWMGVSSKGEILNYVDPDCQFESSGDFVKAAEFGAQDSDLVPVSVSFMGKNHIVVEENQNLGFGCSYSPEERGFGCKVGSPTFTFVVEDLGGTVEDVIGVEGTSPGSLPDSLRSEIYQYFANRTSPGGDRAFRRQRRRERRERQGRKKWEPGHFVKIVNAAPTASRTLQGLWKGISDDMNLDFYLVAYDEIGGIACRRVDDALKPFSGYSPVFWTSNTTFIEFPFSSEEEDLYDSRIHLRPSTMMDDIQIHSPNEVVLRILNINSSYDLVIPDFKEPSTNPRHVEGRIWQYADGTFGFGFLRNNYIIDLKHMAKDGSLVDAVEYCCN